LKVLGLLQALKRISSLSSAYNLTMLRTCTYLFSSNKFPQRRHSWIN